MLCTLRLLIKITAVCVIASATCGIILSLSKSAFTAYAQGCTGSSVLTDDLVGVNIPDHTAKGHGTDGILHGLFQGLAPCRVIGTTGKLELEIVTVRAV